MTGYILVAVRVEEHDLSGGAVAVVAAETSATWSSHASSGPVEKRMHPRGLDVSDIEGDAGS